MHLDLEVFRGFPCVVSAHQLADLPWATPQRPNLRFRFRPTRLSFCAFATQPPCKTFSPEWEVVSRNRASLEVSRPSGGFSTGVRSTRVFHSRHLPPLGFLNPSTACSSSQLARSISYEHHLWGSKFKEHERQLRAEARLSIPRRFIERQSLFGTHKHWTRRQPKRPATKTSKTEYPASFPSWCQPSWRPSARHSPGFTHA
jgi:hypothetical protein